MTAPDSKSTLRRPKESFAGRMEASAERGGSKVLGSIAAIRIECVTRGRGVGHGKAEEEVVVVRLPGGG